MLRHIRPVAGVFYRYTLTMQALHWMMATMVIGLLALGLYMDGLPLSVEKAKLYGLHKSFGALVLGLALVRISVKIISYHPPLPLAGAHAKYVHAASKAGHWALYALLLFMPLSGWLMSSAAGIPVSVFGYVTLPDMIAPDAQLKKIFKLAHEIGMYGFFAVIGMHVLAVIFHMAVIKDRLIFRMLPSFFDRKKR